MTRQTGKRILAFAVVLGASGVWAPRLVDQLGLAFGSGGATAPSDDDPDLLAPEFGEDDFADGVVADGDSGDVNPGAASSPSTGPAPARDVAAVVAALRGLEAPSGPLAPVVGGTPPAPATPGATDPAVAGAGSPATALPPPSALDGLVLRAVLLRADGATALIDSSVVSVGDTLADGAVEVLAIGSDWVRLGAGGVERRLGLPDFQAVGADPFAGTGSLDSGDDLGVPLDSPPPPLD